jgi:hypothetical protein
MKVRRYDTPQLFREDTIERIRILYKEIAEDQKRLAELKRRLDRREGRAH